MSAQCSYSSVRIAFDNYFLTVCTLMHLPHIRYTRPTFRMDVSDADKATFEEDYRRVEDMSEIKRLEKDTLRTFFNGVFSPKAVDHLMKVIDGTAHIPSADVQDHLEKYFHVLPIRRSPDIDLSKCPANREFTLDDDFVFMRRIWRTWSNDKKVRGVNKSDAEWQRDKEAADKLAEDQVARARQVAIQRGEDPKMVVKKNVAVNWNKQVPKQVHILLLLCLCSACHRTIRFSQHCHFFRALTVLRWIGRGRQSPEVQPCGVSIPDQ